MEVFHLLVVALLPILPPTRGALPALERSLIPSVPEDIIAWLQSRRTVAVMDVGSAAPWLRALHFQGGAAVCLWRSGVKAAVGSAPVALMSAPAVLVAASSTRRLESFLRKDCRSVRLVDRTIGGLPVLLPFRASVVLAAAAGMRAEHGSSAAENVLGKGLYQTHHTFHGLLLLPRRQKSFSYDPRWERWRYNPFMPASSSQGARGVAFPVPENLHPEAIESLVQAPIRDMQGATVIGKVPYSLINLLRKIPHPPLNLLRTFARSHKATVEIKECGGSSGCLSDLFLGDSMLLPDLLEAWDVLPASLVPYATWLMVPAPPPLPAWTAPVRAFSAPLWAALAAAAAAYAASWRVVTGDAAPAAVAASVAAFSCCGGTAQARVTSLSQRVQLASVLFASTIVVNTLYQGRLFTLMTDPDRAEPPSTLSAVAATGLDLITATQSGEHALQVSQEDEGPEEARARKLLSNLTRHVQTYELVPNRPRGRFGALLEDYNLRLLREANPSMMREMCAFPRPLVYDFRVLYVKKNSPYQDDLNQLLLWCKAMGVWDFWEHNHYFHLTKRHSVLNDETDYLLDKEPPSDGPGPFFIKDIAAPFYLLLVGCLVSTAVFLYEIKFFVWLRLYLRRRIRLLVAWP